MTSEPRYYTVSYVPDPAGMPGRLAETSAMASSGAASLLADQLGGAVIAYY